MQIVRQPTIVCSIYNGFDVLTSLHMSSVIQFVPQSNISQVDMYGEEVDKIITRHVSYYDFPEPWLSCCMHT
jgi:hypothetical protein